MRNFGAKSVPAGLLTYGLAWCAGVYPRHFVMCRILHMTIEELEAAVLKLEPEARARLAERLLDSLEELSPQENARIWAEEAQRRADALDAGLLSSRSADDVFREANTRL